jgi:hypothetical protein
MDADLMLATGYRPGRDQKMAWASIQNANQGRRRNSGGVHSNRAVVPNFYWAVDGQRLRPLDGRPLDQSRVDLLDLPTREAPGQRRIRYGCLREDDNPRRAGVEPVVNEDAMPHMAFNELGEARAVRVLRLVGHEPRGFVHRDEPVVLEENLQRLCLRRLPGKPIERPHENRGTPAKHPCGIADDSPGHGHEAGHDGLPGEAARNGPCERPAQLGGEPAIERDHRVLQDRDRNRAHGA